MYKIIALCGEAGAGKDTALQAILKQNSEFNEIISHTSRPPREGEEEGINYFYHTDEEFEELINSNQMLEYTVFREWYYGTSSSTLDEEKWNIGVFNPAGIKTLSELPNVKLLIVKIQASDGTRLIRQLTRESNPDVQEIVRRYKTDKEDFENFECDILIPNENGSIEDNVKLFPVLMGISLGINN